MFGNKKKSSWEKQTYSQMGEDAILYFLFQCELQKDHLTWMDIGAYDPFTYSNTYLLSQTYKDRCDGVLVEANPLLAQNIKKHRQGEQVINVGIVPKKAGTDVMPFFVMQPDTLSTFSKEEAEKLSGEGYQIKEVIDIPVQTIDELFMNCFPGKSSIDLLSIDIEGLDREVVRSISFHTWKPYVICMETKKHEKREKSDDYDELKTFLEGQGYMVFADTFMNTIFIDRDYLSQTK